MSFHALPLEGVAGVCMKMDTCRTLTGIGPSHPVGGFPDRIMGDMACDKSLTETREGQLTMLLLSM